MSTAWRERLLLISPIAVIGALFVGPTVEDGPTICPFALCTGMACPGCGMTRAASRLVRGDLGGALSFHPLVPWVAFVAIGAWTWFVLQRTGTVRPPNTNLLNWILILTAIALVAVWIARLVGGTLPDV
jgi:hypothetical protein